MVPLLFLVSIPVLSAEERILVTPPYIDGAKDAREKAETEDIVKLAVQKANLLYTGSIEVVYGPAMEDTEGDGGTEGGGGALYEIKPVIAVNGADSTVSVTMKPTGGGEESSYAVTGGLGRETSDHLARIFHYLWASYHGFFAEEEGKAPIFVEEVSADYIAQGAVTGAGVIPYPYGVTVRENGNLVVALMSLCIEMDNVFRVVREYGRDLREAGNYAFAYSIDFTPGGTLFMKPASGRELYKLIPGSPRTQKIRTTVNLQGPMIVLPDGSFVIVDNTGKKAVRHEGRRKMELPLFTNKNSYLSPGVCGPEGNIWIYDMVESRIKIITPEGVLIDSIIPLIHPNERINPVSMAVYDDGSFLLFGYNGLAKFNRNGRRLWTMRELVTNQSESMPQMAALGVDSKRGIIYMADVMGKRLLKYMDPDYLDGENGNMGGIEEKLVRLNKEIRERPGDTAPLKAKAMIYESLGSYAVAKDKWERVLSLDPFDAEADNHLNEIEIALLLRQARQVEASVRETLNTLGPESARPEYQKAISLYEKVLSISPDNEIERDMRKLKEDFLERSAIPSGKKDPFVVIGISVDNVFPSLLHRYRGEPVGTVKVKNNLSTPIEDCRASFYIKKYMDFPAESVGPPSLLPGEEAELPLMAVLGESVFSLQEDLPVQAEIRVKGKTEGQTVSMETRKTLTLYRRTALTWDNSANLASFITPNEGTVSAFAHRVLRGGGPSSGSGSEPSSGSAQPSADPADFGGLPKGAEGLPDKLLKASKLCDALGTYRIEYIEDPDSPLSEVLGKATTVDTVRFPRTTLLIQSGDCDDSTALLGSLLESSGISTAIMTSPGHVFLAFDTEEPVENRWIFDRPGWETISHRGSLWVPVETTVLDRGFAAAWREASELVRRHGPSEELEFLPLTGLRDSFPPLPLPESSMVVAEPLPERVRERNGRTLGTLLEVFHQGSVEGLKKRIGEETGRRRIALTNKLGILEARFGNLKTAEQLFLDNIEEEPRLLMSYINAANCYIARKAYAEAEKILKKAESLRPDSALLALLQTRVYRGMGKDGTAEGYYAKLTRLSPSLAERYAGLASSPGGDSEGTARAGAEDGDASIWALEDGDGE